jgi:hypothetical protein
MSCSSDRPTPLTNHLPHHHHPCTGWGGGHAPTETWDVDSAPTTPPPPPPPHPKNPRPRGGGGGPHSRRRNVTPTGVTARGQHSSRARGAHTGTPCSTHPRSAQMCVRVRACACVCVRVRACACVCVRVRMRPEAGNSPPQAGGRSTARCEHGQGHGAKNRHNLPSPVPHPVPHPGPRRVVPLGWLRSRHGLATPVGSCPGARSSCWFPTREPCCSMVWETGMQTGPRRCSGQRTASRSSTASHPGCVCGGWGVGRGG